MLDCIGLVCCGLMVIGLLWASLLDLLPDICWLRVSCLICLIVYYLRVDWFNFACWACLGGLANGFCFGPYLLTNLVGCLLTVGLCPTW